MSEDRKQLYIEFLEHCLAKYIRLVGHYEGTSFIYRGDWTEEEFEVMSKADAKARSEYEDIPNTRVDAYKCL